jgi:hypothetical protein
VIPESSLSADPGPQGVGWRLACPTILFKMKLRPVDDMGQNQPALTGNSFID